MRRRPRLLCCTALVVAATAACGSAPTPGTASQPEVFPLTVTRTGGIAGFRDVMVVAGDGLVTLTRQGQRPQRCRLTAHAAGRLSTAASQVPWSRVTPASGSPSFPDDMVTTARSPAGGPIRLEDPQAGTAGRVLIELLNDLSGGPASRTCGPV